MKKFLLKLFITILILILLATTFVFLIGYGYYSNTLNEKSLTERVNEITNDDHFVPFNELSKK